MATFWRYVRIQLIVFAFGIVGPIFLILFFATQPDPSMKWAYWAGLFITAVDVLIALAVTAASDPNKAPADVCVARAVAKRRQSSSGDQSSSSNSYDPFSSTAFSFSSSDSDSSSNDYSSTDSGSTSSDNSSGDSGSSSSDSGSSSSSD